VKIIGASPAPAPSHSLKESSLELRHRRLASGRKKNARNTCRESGPELLATTRAVEAKPFHSDLEPLS